MSIFRHSLAVRLSLLFIGIACAVFLAIGLLAYNGMDQVLKRQQDEALRARVERLELLIQNSSDLNSLIQRPKLYENMLGNQDNLLILKNQNGTALIYINPLQIHIPILPKAEQTWLIDNKKQQATTRLAWKTINYQGQQYLLIAGKQFDEREQVLYSFALKLAGYIGLGILTVCILSALVSYYGLAPLRDLSEQTRLINIQKLNQRVSETSQSDEIRLLSTAMNSMLERIEQGYQQLSRFSEDMAHEFRTPLNNLIGQT
ncbi:MAG TPA: two-component sensor histidine kinase, partial [Acinetobacter radioresistens]|nr:two-component sensor histidine kinase [Acinetobacter radioresistens]